ncbi:MAG: hypothetical protein V4605_09540 [Pseudomonadota bacterium]
MNKVNLRPQVTPAYARQQFNDIVGQVEDQINRGADGYLFPVKRIVFADSPFSLSNNNAILLVDATGGNITINLKPALEWEEKRISIKKIDASVNTVTIDANAAELIDGALTKVITAQYASHELVSQGGAVWIL